MKSKSSLPIALSVQRKNKKKKMAEGGKVDREVKLDMEPLTIMSMENNSEEASKKENYEDEQKLAHGGEVCSHCGHGGQIDDPFDHDEGISHFQEEGPATRIKHNINARNYNAGDDRQLSKQPRDSNEHAAKIDSDKHDLVSQIRKKLKLSKGK